MIIVFLFLFWIEQEPEAQKDFTSNHNMAKILEQTYIGINNSEQQRSHWQSLEVIGSHSVEKWTN